MALDAFDLYIAGWGFRIYNANTADAATLSDLQSSASGDNLLAYALGIMDQVAGTAAKTRAQLIAQLSPLVLLGPDTVGVNLPLQRYHAIGYIPAFAAQIATAGGPLQLAPPSVLSPVVYLGAGVGRKTERRPFDLAAALGIADATARTPRSPGALATEIGRILS